MITYINCKNTDKIKKSCISRVKHLLIKYVDWVLCFVPQQTSWHSGFFFLPTYIYHVYIWISGNKRILQHRDLINLIANNW